MPVVFIWRCRMRMSFVLWCAFACTRGRHRRPTRRRNNYPTFNLWDSEVSGEMQQVNGTDRSRNRDEVDLIRADEQDVNVPDGVVVEMYPEIGPAGIAELIMSFGDVLPSSLAVFMPHRVQDLRIVHPHVVESETVDRNAIHACDYPA